MKKLRSRFILPELQEQLDGVSERALFQISWLDYEPLFGTSDVAATLLRNFATSHACVVAHADAAILFRKQIVQRDGAPEPAGRILAALRSASKMQFWNSLSAN